MKKNKFTQQDLPLGLNGTGKWYVPTKVIQIDERTYALRLGKPIQLGTATEIEQQLGVSRKILPKLAAAGFISAPTPSPCTKMYYFAEIVALLEKTAADPAYWNAVRREAYLNASELPRGKTDEH